MDGNKCKDDVRKFAEYYFELDRAELARLRAIEAAARAYVDLDSSTEHETPSHYLFALLQKALAAKGEA